MMSIEGFPLRGAFHDVEQDDVAEIFQSGEMRQRAANVAGADEGDFIAGHGIFRAVMKKDVAARRRTAGTLGF